MKKIALWSICLLTGTAGFCQPDIDRFNKERLSINRKGMLVLASWAGANVITGAVAQSSTNGETKYFHRMNTIFGSVNLALSGVALLSLNRKTNTSSFAATFKEQSSVEKIFLFNAGFDVAYLAGGFYLIEKGNSNANPEKYKGYGKSLLMQGSALLVFDGIMYLLHNRHGKALLPVLNNIRVTGNSVGVTINL